MPITIKRGGGGIPSLNKYSTEEVKTNDVWLDGKPIYRKVILNNVAFTDNKKVDVSSSNIKNLINSDGYLISQAGSIIPLNSYQADNTSFYFYINSNGEAVFKYLNVGKVSSTTSSYAWIEYTKTTD